MDLLIAYFVQLYFGFFKTSNELGREISNLSLFVKKNIQCIILLWYIFFCHQLYTIYFYFVSLYPTEYTSIVCKTSKRWETLTKEEERRSNLNLFQTFHPLCKKACCVSKHEVSYTSSIQFESSQINLYNFVGFD